MPEVDCQKINKILFGSKTKKKWSKLKKKNKKKKLNKFGTNLINKIIDLDKE